MGTRLDSCWIVLLLNHVKAFFISCAFSFSCVLFAGWEYDGCSNEGDFSAASSISSSSLRSGMSSFYVHPISSSFFLFVIFQILRVFLCPYTFFYLLISMCVDWLWRLWMGGKGLIPRVCKVFL